MSISGKRIENKIEVIDAFHDVATANAVTNTVISDVIGNKTDAAVGSVGTTKTIMAHTKGVLTDTGTTLPAAITAVTTGIDAIHDQTLVGVCTKTSNITTSYTDVVNISDKGVLTGASQWLYHGESVVYGATIKITIDGVELVEITSFAAMDGAPEWNIANSLSFNHRFDTSLQVEHKSTLADKAANTAVSYTTD